MKTKTRIIITAAAVFSVATVIAITAILAANRAAGNPDRLLSLGEKYLLEMEYEQAIVQFLKVIEIEPNNARAYIGAAEAYIGLGETDKAVEILRLGYERTGFATIAAMLEGLEEQPIPEVEETPAPELEPPYLLEDTESVIRLTEAILGSIDEQVIASGEFSDSTICQVTTISPRPYENTFSVGEGSVYLCDYDAFDRVVYELFGKKNYSSTTSVNWLIRRDTGFELAGMGGWTPNYTGSDTHSIAIHDDNTATVSFSLYKDVTDYYLTNILDLRYIGEYQMTVAQITEDSGTFLRFFGINKAQIESAGNVSSGMIMPEMPSESSEPEPTSPSTPESTPETSNEREFPGMPRQFGWFSPAGGASVELTIYQNGSFFGEFYDGYFSEAYPGGAVEQCKFIGELDDYVKISEYEYSMRIARISLTDTSDADYLADIDGDGSKELVVQADMPFDVGNEFKLYLPGRDTSDLPDVFLQDMEWRRVWNAIPPTMPFYGLYSDDTGQGFN